MTLSVKDGANNPTALKTAVVDSEHIPFRRSQAAPNLAASQVSIGSAPTLICAATPDCHEVIITLHDAVDVYIGGAAVTASDGLLVSGFRGNSVKIATTAAIYGCVASGDPTAKASFLKTY